MVGRLLAARLARPFHDADRVLEARFGRSIASVFRELGEPVFRDWEERILEELTLDTTAVLATGGGVVLRETSRARLKAFGLVLWLTAEPAVLAERIRRDLSSGNERPALTAEGTLEEIGTVLASRTPLYRAVADQAFATEEKTAEQIVADIFAWLARQPQD
jgi:shikimate kinase